MSEAPPKTLQWMRERCARSGAYCAQRTNLSGLIEQTTDGLMVDCDGDMNSEELAAEIKAWETTMEKRLKSKQKHHRNLHEGKNIQFTLTWDNT